MLRRLGRSVKLFVFTHPRVAWLLIAQVGFIQNLVAMQQFKGTKRSPVFFNPKKQNYRKETTRNKILFIEQSIPRMDKNAGAITIDQFMELFLRAGWGVSFWPQDRRFDMHYGSLLEQRGVEIISSDHSLKSFKAWWRANEQQYSVVLLSRPTVGAAFLPVLKKYGNPRILYYGHDLHFARLQSEAELTDSPAFFWLSGRFKKIESWIWANADCTYYPSVEEATVACSIVPNADVRSVTPYFFDKTSTLNHCPPQNHKILFVGNFSHPPNVDAVNWLVQEILPSIRNRCPMTELFVVGSGLSPAAQRRLNLETGVNMIGWLSDEALAATYKSCRAVVVPLRFGAGVKHKVIAALAKGRPVVMTEVGAQGMEWLNGSADVVNHSTEFAAATIRLLTDDAYWLLRTATGFEAVQSRFTVGAMASAFDELRSLQVGEH